MTRFAVRHQAWVMAVWLGLAVLLTLLVPSLETVIRRQSVHVIPADMASLQTAERMGVAFDEVGSPTMLFVAMADVDGLGPSARDRYRRLVQRLREDTEHVLLVHDLLASPSSAGRAVSEDGQAWYLPVGVAGSLGDPTAAESIQAVRAVTAEVFDGSSVTARVTGPPATFFDQIAAAAGDLRLVSLVVVTVIGAILLLVFRSVLTALLPLLVIAVSLVVGRGVLAVCGLAGMPISQLTTGFMTTVLLAAGTDYAVFLISRYHEQRRRDIPVGPALVGAGATMGRVILASAGTVAFAFLAMVSARLSAFAGIGPACAIAVSVAALVTLTLLPPVLAVVAARGGAEPKRDRTLRYWNGVAVTVVRRPAACLSVSLVVMLALAAAATAMRISYDDRQGQPVATDSNQGYRLLDRHFGRDTVIPEFLLVESPVDMRTGRALADLDEMASRIAQIPGIISVSGVTRPGGERLDQAQLAWQNGQIGEQITAAIGDRDARRDDLTKLTDGIDQLANGLARLDVALRAGLTPLIEAAQRTRSADAALQSSLPGLRQLAAKAPEIDQAISSGPGLRSLAEQAQSAITKLDPATRSLKSALLCVVTPQCDQIRDQVQVLVALRETGFFDNLAEFGDRYDPETGATVNGVVTDVQAVVAALRKAFGANGDSGDVVANIRRLLDGVHQLADAGRTLAAGVHTLIDDNLAMLSQMGRLAAQLKESAAVSAHSDAASGFYLPSDAFADRRFADMAAHFLAPDGKTARFIIQSDIDPYSQEAMDLSRQIVTVAQAAQPNTSLADATVSTAGFPAVNSDIQRLLRADFVRLSIATLLVVGVILVLLLRAIVAPIYLLATVVLNYVAALGIGVIAFQWGFGLDLTWPVPLLALIILVAVGADYNMLLIARLREESGGNPRIAVLRTVARTGSVITTAGLVFAASMFGLMIGSVLVMIQVGFVIGCGLLLDTFVVRTLVVPAVAVLLGERIWWPAGSPPRPLPGGVRCQPPEAELVAPDPEPVATG